MAAGYQLPPSKCQLKKVTEISFEIFKATQIKEYATMEVTQAKSYVNDRPEPGGLSDPRMGSTDRDFPCTTCHMPSPECPGHFGYIELAEAMFNIGVFDVLLQVIRCVCKSCGALLVDPTKIDFDPHTKGRERLREFVHACGNKRTCGESDDVGGKGCGAVQPKIQRPPGQFPGLFVVCVENENKKIWNAQDVKKVLDLISDEDAVMLGFQPEACRPRDLVITVFPVPPPQVRPTVAFGGGTRSDDELTHKLMSIIKDNDRLRQQKNNGVCSQELDETRQLLQEHVATFAHNTTTYYLTSKLINGKPLKSIAERLKGKYGRLRGNLMGKRVDFSARTVITGDPTLDVDQVGVPISVASTLTFPERVNAANKKRLTDIVRRYTYPSANYILRPNGIVKKLAMVKNREDITLNIGDIVERHVLTNDVVLFNRQPTLHRMSMMGHRVRVLPFNTFRLNLSVTTPYNADFDGDEMNLHVPQSMLSKAELIEMMMVPKNFVSPNKSAPCMGIVQDSLLGCYKITDRETFLDKYFMQNLAMWVGERWDLPIPAIMKPEPLWTGKQIFSMVLPEVTHETEGARESNSTKAFFDPEDKAISIRRGNLTCGIITKGVVGASPGSLIHIIFNEKGADEVTKFINGVQRITAYYLYNSSFSVGIQDTVADKQTLADVKDILQKTSKKVREVAAVANEGRLKRKPGKTLLESFEAEVNEHLNKCRERAARRALQSLRRTNSFKMMVLCGSKGSDMNICQIVVMVGQQNVAGKRIPFGFRRRTLPHFTQDDYGESSRGMVNRGYLQGLRPDEFFFHTMGGREGLIDTACKTADTGYLQRKLIKALEDVHATYDGTVRNAQNHMVQLMYGEDGLDGHKIEAGQSIDVIGKDNKQMADMFRFEYEDNGSFSDAFGGEYMTRDLKNAIRSDPENWHVLDKEYAQVLRDRNDARIWLNGQSKIALPVNVGRLIRNAQNIFEVGRQTQRVSLSPVDVILKVNQLQEELKLFFTAYGRNKDFVIEENLNRARVDSAVKLFSLHLRTMLGSKRVLKEYRLNEKAFEYLLGEIRLKYLQALIQPGEMVGAIAAQSCGEPATQMTLNTFHHAGISSKNVTLGVPRLKELLSVSKTQKTSNMAIHMVPEWRSRDKCESAVHLIEYATLQTLTKNVSIFFDPIPDQTVVEEDRDFVEQEWDMDLFDESDREERRVLLETMAPWIVRLELDSSLFTDKNVQMRELRTLIEAAAPGEFFLEMSQDNQAARVIRLRLKRDKDEAVTYLKQSIPPLLERIHIRGINGIKKVFTNEVHYYTVDEDTGAAKNEKGYCLETEGTALKTILAQEIVDPRKTDTNNIPEIYRVLGIEGARQKLLNEMRAVYLGYSLVINYRHYSILCDTMCQRGYLMAISRTGINRTDAGPLMRASFEETVKILMGSAAFGEKDPIRGVSANLILGNQALAGTGMFDLMLNIRQVRDHGVDQAAAVRAGKQPDCYHSLSSIHLQDPSETHKYGGTPIFNEQFQSSLKGMESSVYEGSLAYTPIPSPFAGPLASAPGGAAPTTQKDKQFQPSEFSMPWQQDSAATTDYTPTSEKPIFSESFQLASDKSLYLDSSEYQPAGKGLDIAESAPYTPAYSGTGSHSHQNLPSPSHSGGRTHSFTHNTGSHTHGHTTHSASFGGIHSGMASGLSGHATHTHSTMASGAYQPGRGSASIDYGSAPSGSDAMMYTPGGGQPQSISPSYVPMTSPSYVPVNPSSMTGTHQQPESGMYSVPYSVSSIQYPGSSQMSASYIPQSPVYTPTTPQQHPDAQDKEGQQ